MRLTAAISGKGGTVPVRRDGERAGALPGRAPGGPGRTAGD
jgi:hypothetical protein